MPQYPTRSRSLATSSTSAAPGRLPFPPEVLELIFAEVSHLILLEDGDNDELLERNKVLASLALCSSQFQQAVYSTLYGDLRLEWSANNAPKLLRSFEENPRLPLLVRRLEATGHLGVWQGFRDRRVQAEMEDADNQEFWFEAYVEENELDEEWEGENSYAHVWEAELVAAAKVEWQEGGLDGWEGRADVAGLGELVDLLDRTTNLQSVSIFGFDHPLPSILADRGPFPSILALELFDEANIVERPTTIASLLLSQTPSLQHLSTGHLPTGLLPPLISLAFRSSNKNRPDANAKRLTEVLELLRPSLRSLEVTVKEIQDGTTWNGKPWGSDIGPTWNENVGWAALLAPFVSSLERLTLWDGHYTRPSMRPNLVNELASAIATSTSLVHLNMQVVWFRDMPPPSLATGTRGVTMDGGIEAVWSPAPLLISLPPTVRSLTLAEDTKSSILELGDRLERMLEALKSTSARPLQVEMKVPTHRGAPWEIEACQARNERALEFVELYAAKGITLVV
ncbi:hypothetical protein RQP46_008775 [Phenoliferia psychrophenolica]